MESADVTAANLFSKAFKEELGDTPVEEFQVTGRPSKAHPRGEDADWWGQEGPEMVARWIEWRNKTPWDIWIAPDGQPGIELELNVHLGSTLVKMFLDRMFATDGRNGRPVVVDVKTGARPPDSKLQLGLYKVGIEVFYPGVRVSGGAYWNGRTGELGNIDSLQWATREFYGRLFSRLRTARAGAIYLPNPSNLCRTCKVGRFCAVNNGRDAYADPDFESMGGKQ